MRRIPTNTVTIQPTTEPVGIEDVKANTWIADNEEDNLFIREQLIPSARRTVEQLACRSLITQTRRQSYDYMPDPGDVYFRYSPVQSVSSITYVDTNGTTQTLAATYYDIDTYVIPARIREAYSQTWPTTRQQTNSVNITAICGYGNTPAAVPIIYRRAIIVLCSHWYDNRDQLGCVDEGTLSNLQNMLAIEGVTVEYA